MAGDVVYKSELDDKAILASLNRINQNVQRIADQGGKSFERIGKSAGVSGVQIGAVAGVVQELTRRFIDLGIQAARAFAQAVAGGIKLNQEAEDIRVALTAIFGGNQDAADAFLATIDEAAKRLGANRQDLRSFAKSILPDVGNIDTVVKLTEQARLLGQDAGQSVQSTRIAFEEALSGNLSSLQRRLNIGKKYIDQIEKEVAETGNLGEAIANALQNKIEDSGLSIENFADNLSIALSKVQAIGTDLQQLLGAAGFDELKIQVNAILEAFEANRDDIENVVRAFGDLAAKVIEIVGSGVSDFLENADYEGIEQLADNLTLLVTNVATLIEQITDPNAFDNTIKEINTVVDALNQALKAYQLLTADREAQLASDQAFFDEYYKNQSAAERNFVGATAGPTVARALAEKGFELGLGSPEEEARLMAARVAAEEAYNEVIGIQTDILNENAEAEADLADKQKERGKQVEEDTAAGKAAGEQYLANEKRLEELAIAESNAAEAREKIDEKVTTARVEAARQLTDTLRDFARQQLDDEIKNAQRREDIARQNTEKIADIIRKNQQRVGDASTDLSRDEADIARKAARSREDVEREAADKRLEIERDYRQTLQRIQDQFNQSAQDAERNNDAKGFLAAIRQRDAAVTDAQRSRADDIAAATVDFEKRRDEQKRSLEYEIEDAQIANARKLEDLQLALERELEEQRIANERDLAEQTTAEQRQAEARRLSQQQELEDIARHNAQKMADLQASLEAEYQLIADYNQKKVENAIATAQAIQAAVKNLLNPGSSGPGSPSDASGVSAGTRRQSRHSGGPVVGGQTYATLPGELLLTPSQSGYIVPGPGMGAGGQVASINNSRTIENVNVGPDMAHDPMLARMVRNIVQSEILNTLG